LSVFSGYIFLTPRTGNRSWRLPEDGWDNTISFLMYTSFVLKLVKKRTLFSVFKSGPRETPEHWMFHTVSFTPRTFSLSVAVANTKLPQYGARILHLTVSFRWRVMRSVRNTSSKHSREHELTLRINHNQYDVIRLPIEFLLFPSSLTHCGTEFCQVIRLCNFLILFW
jgi:hypothetical protein